LYSNILFSLSPLWLIFYNYISLNRRLCMVKAGIIRCQQTEDMCPADADFKAAREGAGVFQETGAAEIVGFVSCGGCPGKRAVPRAKLMVERLSEVLK
jgi:hypothetical protein